MAIPQHKLQKFSEAVAFVAVAVLHLLNFGDRGFKEGSGAVNKVDQADRVRLSPDNLIKVLDSARSELRTYRTLYLWSMAFSVLAPKLILDLQNSVTFTDFAGSFQFTSSRSLVAFSLMHAAFRMPLLLWFCGIYYLLRALSLVTPRLGIGGASHEGEALYKLENALGRLEEDTLAELLRDAILRLHREFENVVKASELFRKGVGLVLGSVLAEFGIAFAVNVAESLRSWI